MGCKAAQVLLNTTLFSANSRRPVTWRRPVGQLGLASNQAAASAFYNYGCLDTWTSPPGTKGKIAMPWNGFATWPIYKVEDATTEVQAWWYAYDLGTFVDGSMIPWNPSWTPASESDAGMLIDIGDTEFQPGWELWNAYGTATRPWVFEFLDGFQDVYQRGWRYGDLLAGFINYRNHETYATYNGRGAGMIPKRSMILTGEEMVYAVQNDTYVKHCLAIVGVNMNAGAYADFNNLFSPPATRVEHPEGQPGAPNIPNSPNSNLFNEGTRFAITSTDQDIENWLDDREYSGDRRATAKALALTLREYGFCAVETGVGQPLFETDQIQSATWSNLGIDSLSVANTFIDGLITDSNLVVVNSEPVFV